MKYKVGDKVKLKFKEGLDELKRQVGDLYIHPDAYKNAGSEQTILECNDGFYRYDASSMFWHESLFEGLVEESLDNDMQEHQKLCDEIMAIQGIEPIEAEMEQIIHCPEGYIFKDENGNVINATKIVLEKKKKEYPKTYDECCKILNIAVRDLDILDNMLDTKEIIYNKNLDRILNSFRKLLICRDAYWKLYGEEMGLGKPWKPDWEENSEKSIITKFRNAVAKFNTKEQYTFAFPTEEMRDAFYENFKSEIEMCKEFVVMVLQDYKIDGNYICISKEELEKWRDHYQEEANTRGRGKIGWFYLGKREVMIDMLKMFEQLEG